MEGDHLVPKPKESELPKFEENLSAPEFVEEASHEVRQAKPALAGLVATEALRHNPNPEVRKLAGEDGTKMNPELLLQQVHEAADLDVAIEARLERSHELKDEPTSHQNDNSQASSRSIVDVPNESLVAIKPVPEENTDTEKKSSEFSQAPQEIFNEKQSVGLYQQAFVVGITTALAILVVFITIKLT